MWKLPLLFILCLATLHFWTLLTFSVYFVMHIFPQLKLSEYRSTVISVFVVCVHLLSAIHREQSASSVLGRPSTRPFCLGSHWTSRTEPGTATLTGGWLGAKGPDVTQEGGRSEEWKTEMLHSLGKPTREFGAGSLAGMACHLDTSQRHRNELVCTFWPLRAT